MPPVFNRHSPNPHPYDAALNAMLSGGNADEIAIARNIQYDPRVDPQREQSLNQLMSTPVTAKSINRAINDYFHEKVLTRILPDFVQSNLNADNILCGNPNLPRRLNRHLALARVLDLNGLARVLDWGKGKRYSVCDRFPGSHNENEIRKWFDDLLDGQPTRRRDRILGEVFTVLNAYRENMRYQPTWATA